MLEDLGCAACCIKHGDGVAVNSTEVCDMADGLENQTRTMLRRG